MNRAPTAGQQPVPNAYNPEKHHRRSIRLKGFDYKQPGAYFVTICTQNRECFFGAIADGRIQSNEVGLLVVATWRELPSRFAAISLDAFVVMPNHLHGIVRVGAQLIAPCGEADREEGEMNRAPTLGEIIRTYKAVSARTVRKIGNANFAWQRNQYEHIIRDELSCERIRQYILDNPARWDIDRDNPQATTIEPKDAWKTNR